MKNKIIPILGAAVITVGIIGGVVFATNTNNATKSENKQSINRISNVNDIETFEDRENNGELLKTVVSMEDLDKEVINNYTNSSNDVYEDMVNMMTEGNFNDMVTYMEEGNYEAMDDYMNNISEEDYQGMIDSMKEYGYGYMAEMMESIDREDMIEMHNSMGSMHGGTYNGDFNMMKGFGSDR